jgi:hypothetical protein
MDHHRLTGGRQAYPEMPSLKYGHTELVFNTRNFSLTVEVCTPRVLAARPKLPASTDADK